MALHRNDPGYCPAPSYAYPDASPSAQPAAYPSEKALHCEALDHLVCQVCSLCFESGKVCRVCSLCIEHQDESDVCEVTRWDPRTGEDHLIGHSHELWSPSTGRWGG